MNVAFIFLHPFSESLGSIVRVRELAISLRKFGVTSYILTPYENSHSIIEGVNVVSIGGEMQRLGLGSYLYKIAKSAYYNRFFAYQFLVNRKLQAKLAARLAKAVVPVLEKLDIDLIQAEQDVALPTALEVREKTTLPLLVDLHNITTEELVAANIIKKESREFSALQQLFGKALQEADPVVVVSSEMKKYVATNYGIPLERITVVPPGARPRITEIKEKKFPPKVVYSGLVAHREHVDLFVKSMPMILKKAEAAKFYITRKGEALSGIRKLSKTLRVNPIYFWYPSIDDFYEFLSSCHVGVLPSTNDLARKMGTPVKLFDYLSAGLPVVTNDVGTWSNIIKNEKVGKVTKDNPADFASGILELVQSKDMVEECGRRGLELVTNKFNWDSSAKILLRVYKSLLN